jgi:hypothetical protein
MDENYQQAPTVQPQNGIFTVTNLYDAVSEFFRWPNNWPDTKLVIQTFVIPKMNCPHKLRRSC